MREIKYYLKQKCSCSYHKRTKCLEMYQCKTGQLIGCCSGKGFIRIADVTELMETIKSVVTKQIWILIIGITKNLIEVVEE